MATHSSTLAWKIPWAEEPGRLQSMGSLRVGRSWATSLSLFTFMHWRRKWQPTPVFLPGESQGQRGLVGCRLWGHTELDTTAAAAAVNFFCRGPERASLMAQVVKNLPASAGDVGSVPESGRSLEEGMVTPTSTLGLEKRSLVGCSQWACTLSH